MDKEEAQTHGEPPVNGGIVKAAAGVTECLYQRGWKQGLSSVLFIRNVHMFSSSRN